MFKKFLKWYYHWMLTYYKEQEIAKEAYMKIVEARHLERMSELKKLVPYDPDLTKAEINRHYAYWDLLNLERRKVSDKKFKYLDKWTKRI